MTPTNLDKLEEIAKAATQGEWKIGNSDADHAPDAVTIRPGYWVAPRHYPRCYELDDLSYTVRDARHIAAFDPPTALGLIAEIRELREENKMLSDEHRAVIDFGRKGAGGCMMTSPEHLRSISKRALAKLEAMRWDGK